MSDGLQRPGDRLRIVVLFDRLGPYHHARLRAAAGKAEIVAVEMSEVDSVYAWDKVPDASEFRQITAFRHLDPDKIPAFTVTTKLNRILSDIRPDAVAVPGWASKAALAALACCAMRGTPAIVMSASTLRDRARAEWKEFAKRRILKLASAALAGGAAQADYLAQLGVPRDRIFVGYDVVDNEHFARGAELVRHDAWRWRKSLGLPRRYFVTSSRFVEKKNLVFLLEAYALYRSLAGERAWSLVLVGDGPERRNVEAAIERWDLQGKALLPGFKQYDELPAYYALAGAFVLASLSEQWGLVVNEAMAAGLPVLVSERCGCARDLVEKGANGFTFDPENVQQLAALMQRMTAMDGASMGDASRRIIARWSPDAFASGLVDAARRARTVERAA